MSQKDKTSLIIMGAALFVSVTVYTIQAVYTHREYVRNNTLTREALMQKMVELHAPVAEAAEKPADA